MGCSICALGIAMSISLRLADRCIVSRLGLGVKGLNPDMYGSYPPEIRFPSLFEDVRAGPVWERICRLQAHSHLIPESFTFKFGTYGESTRRISYALACRLCAVKASEGSQPRVGCVEKGTDSSVTPIRTASK